MSENDFIDDMFADLDSFYPGSKQKRRTVTTPAPKPVKETGGWDERPYIKTLPNGKDVEMFTLGSLAQALGRPIITLRAWMTQGHLPASPYRLPAKPNKNGEMQQGRRLYSRAMIEAAVEIFARFDLLDTNRVEWVKNQQVSLELAEAWNKIRAQEQSNDN